MYGIIEYEEIKNDYLLVDVRSPGEFHECTIPGSKNIPLFDNDERKEIGILYKQVSIEEAKKHGIRIVSRKLPEIYESIQELKKENKNIVLFCERGGMRSTSLFNLFNSLGLGMKKLNGGYKSYRNYVNKTLPDIIEQKTFIILHGYTGTGKTEILKRLIDLGYDALDLEEKANHRGSLLGKVGLDKRVSQKQFEGDIFDILRNSKSDKIFIEAESRRIGKLFIPDSLFDKMKTGKHVLVESDIEVRATRIVNEYITSENSKEEIINSLNDLRKYISNDIVNKLISEVENNNFKEVTIQLMEKYYDPMYNHNQKNYNYDILINSDNLQDACDALIKKFNKNE